MPTVHTLDTSPENYTAIQEGNKSFQISKNDKNYKIGDFLLLNEFEKEKCTGEKIILEITYISKEKQHDNYVVLSIREVPHSFIQYHQKMSTSEKEIFKSILTHMKLYGSNERAVSNTFADILHTLLDGAEITNDDRIWFMEYWSED